MALWRDPAPQMDVGVRVCHNGPTRAPDGERTMRTAARPEATALRKEIWSTYSEVATNPDARSHFINGWPMAERLGHPMNLVGAMPAAAVESFSGVEDPRRERADDRRPAEGKEMLLLRGNSRVSGSEFLTVEVSRNGAAH